VNFHTHLLSSQQQFLYRLCCLGSDLSFLELLDDLIADEETHLVVLLVFLCNLDEFDDDSQGRGLLLHLGDDEFDCFDEKIRIFAAHSQTDQELVDIQGLLCPDGEEGEQLPPHLHGEVGEKILDVGFDR
jgi:hypothetical protein